IQGQANHFFRHAPEKIQYEIDRYQNDTKRLHSVLEARTFTWVCWGPWAGIDVTKFPKLNEGVQRIEERPAVKKGL
ncbi:hypothetical protein BCR34DRAFT_445542, partial [Clohesyomyces aquaticus]